MVLNCFYLLPQTLPVFNKCSNSFSGTTSYKHQQMGCDVRHWFYYWVHCVHYWHFDNSSGWREIHCYKEMYPCFYIPLLTVFACVLSKSMQCISRPPILEPNGKNFLEKVIFYLRIFFQVHYGYKKKICPELFLMSVFDPCVSQGRFFGQIFRL